ncbi:MAG: hypothetical protein LUE10_08255 [Alistipes sp.]|nr:hypothetical protein [Alistipes sp.]
MISNIALTYRTVIVLMLCAGASPGQIPGKTKHPYPVLENIKFIDARQYSRSEEYTAIFGGDKWQEATGIWQHMVTSSGIHWYHELEFSGRSEFTWKSGVRLSPALTDKEEQRRNGYFVFDPESSFLTLDAENIEDIYELEYFTTADAENVNWREIMILTRTGKPQRGKPLSYTFLR